MLKICGLNNEENVLELLKFQPDLMGFIFYEKSARKCTLPAAFVRKTKFGSTRKVGVFVNEEINRLISIYQNYELDLVQLHGAESPEYCAEITANQIPFIKVFSIGTGAPFPETASFEKATYFLFDTKGKLPGGNGVTFNWEVLENYRGKTPFLLSGGIGPEHLGVVPAKVHPQCIGLDVNSRFELSPGLKNLELLKAFIDHV